jgi:hypothetical protein
LAISNIVNRDYRICTENLSKLPKFLKFTLRNKKFDIKPETSLFPFLPLSTRNLLYLA